MTIPSRTHVRCKLCGVVLPGWLQLPNCPNSAMLLHHLGNHHLAEAKPYLKRNSWFGRAVGLSRHP